MVGLVFGLHEIATEGKMTASIFTAVRDKCTES